MSTAGKATYHSAVGRSQSTSFRTRHYSGKDQTAHTQLKFRQVGQSSAAELQQKDFRHELDQRELKYTYEKDKKTAWLAQQEEKVDVPLLLRNQPELDVAKLEKYDDKDVEVEEDSDFDSSRFVLDVGRQFMLIVMALLFLQ